MTEEAAVVKVSCFLIVHVSSDTKNNFFKCLVKTLFTTTHSVTGKGG